MPYIDQRWLGGLLTNFQTINKRIRRLHDLRDWTESGTMDLLPVRERIAANNERDKLETNLGGVADMQRPPDAVFVVDLKTEAIGVREANRLQIPIIGLVDTNCDPDPVQFVIPGNDDAIRSCKIIIDGIADVARDNAQAFRAQEEAARREREEQERKEAEEKAQREAEEQERREAEERARREAEEAGFSPDEPATPSGTRPPRRALSRATSAIASMMSLHERIASSLPGIRCTGVGVAVGVHEPDDRNLAGAVASRTPISSVLMSTTNIASGGALHVATPPRFISSLSRSRIASMRSRTGSSSIVPPSVQPRELVQAPDALRDRLEVGEQAAEPALVM